MKAGPHPLPGNPAIATEAEAAAARADSTSTGFEQFLSEHRDALVAYLRPRTASEEDAQDAAQESLVRLMRYRGEGSIASWKALLYRIATNVANDQARQARTHRASAHVPIEDNVVALPSGEPSQDEWVSQQQDLLRLREAILTLPPRCREVYLLNRIDGMSYSQVARHCGVSVKAVEKHITKALVVLRKRLGDWDAGAL